MSPPTDSTVDNALTLDSLFPPITLSALGGALQDGGLINNNPIKVAYSEATKVWPKDTAADIVVSLGTGTSQDQSPQVSHFRHSPERTSLARLPYLLCHGFVTRLAESFWYSLDGESTWQQFIDSVDDAVKRVSFRFNTELRNAPDLDDVSQLVELMTMVRRKPEGSYSRRQVLLTLLCSCFFFMLDCEPEPESGQYRCRGAVRCRRDCESVIVTLQQFHIGPFDILKDDRVVGTISGADDICKDCRLLHNPVTFLTPNLEETVTISLRLNPQIRKTIAGFPQSMQWFVKQQMLDTTFGTPDHGHRGAPKCSAYRPSMKRKAVEQRAGRRKRARQ